MGQYNQKACEGRQLVVKWSINVLLFYHKGVVVCLEVKLRVRRKWFVR